jgi:hypothetical protein
VVRKSKGSIPSKRKEHLMDLGIYLVLVGEQGREQLLTYMRVRCEREREQDRQRPRQVS